MTKTAEKKTRKPPSVERQLALALVSLIETIADGSSTGNDELDVAATDAKAILKTHGYGELESIPARVARLEGEIEKALERKDYDALPKLGQEMKRAMAGKPPLEAEKEPRAIPKAKTDKAAPKTETVAVKCSYDGVCNYTGEGIVGSPCPDCESELIAA